MAIERPSAAALWIMVGIWFVLTVLPAFTLFIPTDSLEAQITLFFGGPMVTFFVYVIPAFFSSFYLLFEAAGNLLVFLIYHYVSNITPLLIISLIFLFASSSVAPVQIALYSTVALLFWYATMANSIEAIHYVDPSWNKVAPGLLKPSIAYLFGLDKGFDDDSA